VNSAPHDRSSGGIAGLLLAAGAGARFGGPKQLAELAGRPLLTHAIEAARRAPLDRVVVVLGARAQEIRARVELGGAELVICVGWAEGMSAPLRAGIEAIGESGAALVLLGDQPLVTAAAVERVLAARSPGRVAVRATYGGAPDHPVLLERALFGAVADLRADTGARALLDRPDVAAVPCDGLADPLDVDTPADLELAAARLAG
jgi:CTP:molybdopterin cytidylyltransferase MocA